MSIQALPDGQIVPSVSIPAPLAGLEHAIADICRRYQVTQLDAFGPVTIEGFDPERGDVSMVVTFAPDARVSYMGIYYDLRVALEALLGQPVQLLVDRAIRNPYLRAQVDRERRRLYPV